MINDEFLKAIPNDLNSGVQQIVTDYFTFYEKNGVRGIHIYKQCVDYYHLLEAFLISRKHSFNPLKFSNDKKMDINLILNFFSNQKSKLEDRLEMASIKDSKEKFNLMFGNAFSYEFTDGDLTIIQRLINEIRDYITTSEWFTDDHRQRMLNKLEKLQSELHKKVSDLDKFWGFFVDASIVFGKIGENAKPFFDRIKDLLDIIWRTQARAEELPSNAQIPFLPRNNEN
jgi:hypothetical protein